MKFTHGDETDTALLVAIQHEFLRCSDAFHDFLASAERTVVAGQSPRTGYRAYNDYGRFIHHLYEFYIGAAKRDRANTQNIDHEVADRIITAHATRILADRRRAVIEGTAPSWENDIDDIPESVPPDFAERFRRCRNVVFGHANYGRANYDLSGFFSDYHVFVLMLFFNARKQWGREDIPHLAEITSFQLHVKMKGPGIARPA